MIRIAFLTPSLHIGGAEMWILSLARNFLQARPVALIHTSHFDHPDIVRQAKALMPILRPRDPRNYRQLKLLTERACRTADVLVTWGYGPLARLTRDLDIPVVEVSHSDGAWGPQSQLVHHSSRGADYHVAVSHAAVGAFPEHLQEKVNIIYNGAEVDRVTPRRGRRLQREAWGFDDERRIALFLGRFADVKQPLRLIEALTHLPPKWTAVFVGHGPLEAELREAASTLPSDRCLVLPPVSHVGDCLAAADAVVLPSDFEGMPLTLIEAWLAGTPTVATNCNVVRHLCQQHGPICQMVPVRPSGEELASGIQAALRGGMEHPARIVAWSYYTASAMAQRWEEYLLAICSHWNQSRICGRHAWQMNPIGSTEEATST